MFYVAWETTIILHMPHPKNLKDLHVSCASEEKKWFLVCRLSSVCNGIWLHVTAPCKRLKCSNYFIRIRYPGLFEKRSLFEEYKYCVFKNGGLWRAKWPELGVFALIQPYGFNACHSLDNLSINCYTHARYLPERNNKLRIFEIIFLHQLVTNWLTLNESLVWTVCNQKPVSSSPHLFEAPELVTIVICGRRCFYQSCNLLLDLGSTVILGFRLLRDSSI